MGLAYLLAGKDHSQPRRVDERELMEIEDDFSRLISAEPVDRCFQLARRGEIELADQRQRVATVALVFPEAKLAHSLGVWHYE